MNANQMSFGVEVETVATDTAVTNDGLRIGAYHHGIQVPYLPQGWKAERDGSIDNSRGGHACEIVSPILRGQRGSPRSPRCCGRSRPRAIESTQAAERTFT